MSGFSWSFKVDEAGEGSFSDQFSTFNPVDTDVPDDTIPHLADIAYQARSLLESFTAQEIEEMARKVSREIAEYFFKVKSGAVECLITEVVEGKLDYEQIIEEFFDWDGMSRYEASFYFRDGMEDELPIATASNTNEVNAFKDAIQNRDEDFDNEDFDDEDFDDEDFDGSLVKRDSIKPSLAEDSKSFAALSLWMVADSLNHLDNPIQEDLAAAGNSALKALDAVCYAEYLDAMDRLERGYAEDLLLRSIDKLEANAMHEAMVAVQNKVEEEARGRNLHRSERMNAARHIKNNEAKEMAIKEWEKDRTQFPSAEKAGRYLADWLESQDLIYEPRTVTLWIRAHAKKKGVIFR
jgi:hypothetical protein